MMPRSMHFNQDYIGKILKIYFMKYHRQLPISSHFRRQSRVILSPLEIGNDFYVVSKPNLPSTSVASKLMETLLLDSVWVTSNLIDFWEF